MVTKLEILVFGKNFVQPAESTYPKWAENPFFRPFSSQKRGVFRKVREKNYFFQYEYAKPKKIPFLLTQKRAPLPPTGAIEVRVSLNFGGWAVAYKNFAILPYYI